MKIGNFISEDHVISVYYAFRKLTPKEKKNYINKSSIFTLIEIKTKKKKILNEVTLPIRIAFIVNILEHEEVPRKHRTIFRKFSPINQSNPDMAPEGEF